MNEKEFGKYIEELRIKAGYESAESLSRVSGVWNSTIKRIEHGKTKHPSIEVLRKLSTYLKVSYEELLKKAGYIDSIEIRLKSGENVSLDKLLESISEEDKKLISLILEKYKK
jgi:transcriptional regulator with XRE-family HTH domain